MVKMQITKPCPQRFQFNQPDKITESVNFNVLSSDSDLSDLQSTLL